MAETPKAPLPEQVRWERLSRHGAWTLAHIAVPVAAGLTYSEVAQQLGCSVSHIAVRMRDLRAELRATAAN